MDPFFIGRGDRIRTCGLCVPNAALYQTEPRLEVNVDYYIMYFGKVKHFFRLFSIFFEKFSGGLFCLRAALSCVTLKSRNYRRR